MNIRGVMSRPVIVVDPSTRLVDVAALLLEHKVSGVAVVQGTELLGIVSETDIVAVEAGVRPTGAPHERDGLTAGDVMSSPATTISPDASIHVAAARMLEADVHRLPVVQDGKLVGMVSRSDLVRAYARSDQELEEEVREHILHRILALDPDLFAVSVIDGVVRVRGWVERRTMRDLLAWAIRLLPGVSEAEVDVTWSLDDTTEGHRPRKEPRVPAGIASR